MGRSLGLGDLLELGWLGNGLDNLLSVGLLNIFRDFLLRLIWSRSWVGSGTGLGSDFGTVGGAVVPVLCDTVVAVAVVVEIDLEVKESVVHYCSVVVIKSFGAIINVLVTFLIIICSLEKTTFYSHRNTETRRKDDFSRDPVLVMLRHLYVYLLSKSSPSRCIRNKSKFHGLFWSQNDLISWTSFIRTLKLYVTRLVLHWYFINLPAQV